MSKLDELLGDLYLWGGPISSEEQGQRELAEMKQHITDEGYALVRVGTGVGAEQRARCAAHLRGRAGTFSPYSQPRLLLERVAQDIDGLKEES